MQSAVRGQWQFSLCDRNKICTSVDQIRCLFGPDLIERFCLFLYASFFFASRYGHSLPFMGTPHVLIVKCL